MNVARIAVLDDHPIVLEGIAGLLSRAGHDIVLSTTDPDALIDVAARGEIDLAVIDLNLPSISGLDVASTLHAAALDLPIILLTSSISVAQSTAAMRAEIGGIVLKESAVAQLVRCVDTVLSGDRWYDAEVTKRVFTDSAATADSGGEKLSARELAVADLITRGFRNKEIAERLDIGEATVKSHLHNIFTKLGISSRTQLAVMDRKRLGFAQ